VVFQQARITGEAFAWLLVLREAVTLVATRAWGERLLGYYPAPGFRGRGLRGFVAPALVFGMASVVYTIYFHCDVFFVYALRGKNELGAYAAAFRPINPLLVLPWLLMSPIVPVLSATVAEQMDDFVRLVRGACGVAIGIGTTAAVCGVMLAPDLVHLLYKGSYLQGPLSSINAFRWLAIALGMVSVTTVLTASLLALGRERSLLTIGVAALLFNAALNLTLLWRHDFTAAAFVTAATELLYLIAATLAFRLIMHRSAVTWSSALYVAPALITAAILHFTPGGPAPRVACGIALGILSVIGILSIRQTRRLRQELAGASPAMEVLPAEGCKP
jgi:O-antigen/teichoic acid export membrane protein